MDSLLIRLQSSVVDFDASFIKELQRFELIMQARGLDPSSYVICKDRVQFTELPFFIRPGGNGYNYTVFIDDESFTITKANDMAFLGYFEQLCAVAIASDVPLDSAQLSVWSKLSTPFRRIKSWFEAPLFDEPTHSDRS
jgi:hypothetical protein